jgi:signal transduction histidine kinase
LKNQFGRAFAWFDPMSSLENIYLKMAPALEPATLASLRHEPANSDGQKQIGRDVAHELNNIFTIIRGYADRMIIKHGENPALRPELLLIAENVRRAELLVRHSTYPRSRPAVPATAQTPA